MTIHVYVDGETSVTKTVTLRRMTVRQYLRAARLLGVSLAMDDEEPQWFTREDPAMPEVVAELTRLAGRDDVIFWAHNWSFDGRLLRYVLGVPYPLHARCTLEASMCAFPSHPGGYKLDNLARTLNLPSGHKTGEATNVNRMAPDELAEYCKQDVRLCRDLARILVPRVAHAEWRVAELCSRAKECYFEVDHDAVVGAMDTFGKLADQSALDLANILEDEDRCAFSMDETGGVRSVKPAQVKRLLLEHLGFDTPTVSRKKINPVALAGHESAKAAIEATSKANSALSSKRRVAPFLGVTEIDAELNFYAAHTGRFASRAAGRGLNLLNLPKHNPDAARLVRSMYRLPSGLCFVRADEANVEYRVSGLLSGCAHVLNLFRGELFADPYSTFGTTATGKKITKADKIRQLFKSAVLGLGYGMGLELWVAVLLSELAKPKPAFTLKDLQDAVDANHWEFPGGGYPKRVLNKTGADIAVVTVAAHTRRLFHEIHPEFFALAKWLMTACEQVAAGAGNDWLRDFYDAPGAPDPRMLMLEATERFEGRSIEVTIGDWGSPTVLWRDLAIREVGDKGGACLTVMAGKKGYRALRPSHCIENVVQSGARNRTCRAKLALEDRGYPYVFNVHDELLPITPLEVDEVLRARSDLIDILGPSGREAEGDWAWAVVIDPAEINVSRSWYERDMGAILAEIQGVEKAKNTDWWAALPSHPEYLERLP